MTTIRKQLHDNAVALISLFIAVNSLAYNTWRNEKTEEQRNIRHAAFRVLENLGETDERTELTREARTAEQDLTRAIREARTAVLDVLTMLE